MDGKIDEMVGLFKVLNGDLKKSVDKLNECESDEFNFYGRAYLRAYASWIEGSIWIYKNIIMRSDAQWYKQMPLESQLYLFEQDWSIKNNGNPYLQQKKIKTKENLKCFFVVMGQMFERFDVETDTDGWCNIVHFYTVRDRTMHPTSMDSLNLCKKDLDKCNKGRVWLDDIFCKLRKKIYEKTEI